MEGLIFGIFTVFSHILHTIGEIRTRNEKFHALIQFDFKAAHIKPFSVSRIFYSKI